MVDGYILGYLTLTEKIFGMVVIESNCITIFFDITVAKVKDDIFLSVTQAYSDKEKKIRVLPTVLYH